MSKCSRRANREQIKARRKERKRVQKSLREERKSKGFAPSTHATISNHKCEYESVDEEREARNEALCEQVRIFRSRLPFLLARLSKIEDTRNPKKIKHKHYVYVLEANLSFRDGMTIPLMSEFLSYKEGDPGKQQTRLRAQGLLSVGASNQGGFSSFADHGFSGWSLCQRASDGALPQKQVAVHDKFYKIKLFPTLWESSMPLANWEILPQNRPELRNRTSCVSTGFLDEVLTRGQPIDIFRGYGASSHFFISYRAGSGGVYRVSKNPLRSPYRESWRLALCRSQN